MIPVRLIGGLHDNDIAKVDPDQVELVVRKNMPAPATRAFNRNFGLAESTATVVTTRYTRRVVRTPEGEVVFFAFHEFSDLEALQHALGV